MKKFFYELFQYNQQVNELLISQLISHREMVTSRSLDLAAHIQLVHKSWNNRMLLLEGLTDFWTHRELSDVQADNIENNDCSRDIIDKFNMEASFGYTNSKGVAFSNSYTDGLFHIINHCNYHRGQINAELRRSGVEPVITDYIFYKR